MILNNDPDFLIIKGNYCLIIECKSGHFQNEEHPINAEKYSKFSLREIEKECRKIMHNPKLSIDYYDVAFQYYHDMISEAESKWKNEFSKLKQKVHVFSCEKGNLYSLYTNRDLFDRQTTIELRKGFKIPEKPDPRYNLTRKADDDLIAHAIINFGLKNISWMADPIKFDINDENLFGHYNIKINKIKKVCSILEKLKIIKKIEGKTDDRKYVINRYQTTRKQLFTIGIPLLQELFKNKRLRDIIADDLEPLESYDKNIDVV